MKQKVLFIILNEYTDWEGAFLSTALHVGVIPGGEIKIDEVSNEVPEAPSKDITLTDKKDGKLVYNSARRTKEN